MSSNTIPESLSSDDLTSSQLEYDSDEEDEKRCHPEQYIITELTRISTALENINNTQQKYGTSLLQYLDEVSQQNKDLVRVEHEINRRESDRSRREQNKVTWFEYTCLTLFGITTFVTVFDVCKSIFRK